MRNTIKLLLLIAVCAMLCACSAAQVRKETERLKHYHDIYCDVYAAQLLRSMFDSGDITADDYGGDYAATGDGYDALAFREYAELSDMMNGRLEELSCEAYSINVSMLMNDLFDHAVCISLFDDQRTRDRFEEAVGRIDAWLAQPNEENTLRMEEAITHRDVSSGEVVYIYYYIFSGMNRISGSISVEGQKYTFFEYIDGRIVDSKKSVTLFEYQEEAAANLRLQNRRPNSN